MKVLPARPAPPTSQPTGPAQRTPEAAPSPLRQQVRSQGGALEAGVLVVALAGLALAAGAGREPRGAGPLALYVALVTPLTLAGALTLPRLAARHPRGDAWLRRGALLAVTLAGAVLRFRGLGFALPYVPHPDEPAVVNVAQRMLRTGDLDPGSFVYPSLYIYLQALVYALHLGWGFAQGTYEGVRDLPETTDIVTTAPGVYLWGRALTAGLATAALPLLYATGRRLYGAGVGLVAALLLAFAPATIADAHLITVDVPSAVFAALAFYWIVELYCAPLTQGRTWPWWPVARAGIGVGLAAATKYNAALIAVPFALVPLLRGMRAPWRVWLGGGLAATATFLAATPFAIPNLPTFLGDTAGVITHYRYEGHGQFTGDSNWRYFAQYLWGVSPWTFALALLGLTVMALRHRRVDLLVLPFPLLYYGTLAGLRVNFTRNLLPLDPFLALAGAVGLLGAARWLAAKGEGRRTKGERPTRAVASSSLVAHRSSLLSPLAPRPSLVALLVLPLALAGPTAVAGHLDTLRATADSRVAAQRWMEANLPRGVYWLVHLPPEAWRENTNAVSAAVFGPLSQHPPEWYPAHGFGYLLLDRGEYGPLLENPAAKPDEAAWYAAALARFPLVREWPDGASLGAHLTLHSTGLDLAGLTMQQRRDARFGGDAGDPSGEIALLGYNLGPTTPRPGPPLPYFPPPAERSSGTAHPGDRLGLTLLWRPLRRPAGDYQVFVHLRDQGSRTVAQRDTRPQNNGYPTTHWREGELVLDSADLALPAALPPGRYTVVVGLYPPGRARLPARPSPDAPPLPDDELPLATLEVAR